MQISRQHIDANGSMTYQLSDPLDRTLHLQSLGTMILKIICSFLQWRKNALRIALPCIPVSISSRLSLLTPCQKPRRLSKFGPLSSPAIRKMVDRHSTCPPKPANECFSIYPKNNCCWIFFPISSATMSCALTTISNPFLHASILVHLCQSPGPTFPCGMSLQTLKQRNDVV